MTEADNSTTKPAPVRAVKLTITIEADSREELSRVLFSLSQRVERGELTSGCSGSPGSGYIYELLETPEMTHDQYFADIQQWLEDRKGEGRTND